MMRLLGKVGFLTLVYALTLASFAPADLAAGAALGSFVLLLFQSLRSYTNRQISPAPNPTLPRRAIAFLPWAWAVLKDVVAGTWQVLVIVLGMRPLSHCGIVSIPIGERSATGVAVSGLATTLSPGTVLVDVNWDEGVMLIHAIDASDPDQVRESLQRMYDEFQRYVFP